MILQFSIVAYLNECHHVVLGDDLSELLCVTGHVLACDLEDLEVEIDR